MNCKNGWERIKLKLNLDMRYTRKAHNWTTNENGNLVQLNILYKRIENVIRLVSAGNFNETNHSKYDFVSLCP